MSVDFAVVSGYHQFTDVEEKDLASGQLNYELIGGKTWTWPTPTEGGLVFGVESSPLQTYQGAPVARGGIGRDGALSVTRVQLTGGLQSAVLQQLALDPRQLIGASVTIRRTYAELPADDSASYRLLFRGVVTQWEADPGGAVVLEVSDRWFDWGSTVSKRTYAKLCDFRFKDARCGYVGGGTFCDKTLVQCQNYGNQVRFGGFPDAPDLQFKGL